ncbi:MAG: isoprenylcysteine carboxylmethyltransferase family protein [Anaerolineales bacterium]|nr:isoprenylcysteine carboxylmethyltransferase family protein [Anaerolineales bacterium]MCB9128411.1 isoprenylcysteine carboxylmethyltransferase family protein [Ardenticatenales bacterium]
MARAAAHTRRWRIAELIFGLPFGASFVLHAIYPMGIAQGAFLPLLTPIGIVLILLAIGIIGAARRELARYDQPTDPGQPTGRLVTTGPYSRSRNPLYLAAALFFLGLALLLNTVWGVVALLLAVVACRYLLIVPEERYLAAKFGADYGAYCASVGRWLGRRRP